jgi:hypothetical protein
MSEVQTPRDVWPRLRYRARAGETGRPGEAALGRRPPPGSILATTKRKCKAHARQGGCSRGMDGRAAARIVGAGIHTYPAATRATLDTFGCPSWKLIEPCAARQTKNFGMSWRKSGRCDWRRRAAVPASPSSSGGGGGVASRAFLWPHHPIRTIVAYEVMCANGGHRFVGFRGRPRCAAGVDLGGASLPPAGRRRLPGRAVHSRPRRAPRHRDQRAPSPAAGRPIGLSASSSTSNGAIVHKCFGYSHIPHSQVLQSESQRLLRRTSCLTLRGCGHRALS